MWVRLSNQVEYSRIEFGSSRRSTVGPSVSFYLLDSRSVTTVNRNTMTEKMSVLPTFSQPQSTRMDLFCVRTNVQTNQKVACHQVLNFWQMSYVVIDRAAWRGSVGLFSAVKLVHRAKKRANKKCKTAVHALLPRDSPNGLLCALVKGS